MVKKIVCCKIELLWKKVLALKFCCGKNQFCGKRIVVKNVALVKTKLLVVEKSPGKKLW